MGQVTHLCNFGTSLYQRSRRIPNIAILNVVIPNEVVGGDGGDDGGIDQLSATTEERDLGIVVTDNLGVSTQCAEGAKEQ